MNIEVPRKTLLLDTCGTRQREKKTCELSLGLVRMRVDLTSDRERITETGGKWGGKKFRRKWGKEQGRCPSKGLIRQRVSLYLLREANRGEEKRKRGAYSRRGREITEMIENFSLDRRLHLSSRRTRIGR